MSIKEIMRSRGINQMRLGSYSEINRATNLIHTDKAKLIENYTEYESLNDDEKGFIDNKKSYGAMFLNLGSNGEFYVSILNRTFVIPALPPLRRGCTMLYNTRQEIIPANDISNPDLQDFIVHCIDGGWDANILNQSIQQLIRV